jgi:hypothetical protein
MVHGMHPTGMNGIQHSRHGFYGFAADCFRKGQYRYQCESKSKSKTCHRRFDTDFDFDFDFDYANIAQEFRIAVVATAGLPALRASAIGKFLQATASLSVIKRTNRYEPFLAMVAASARAHGSRNPADR